MPLSEAVVAIAEQRISYNLNPCSWLKKYIMLYLYANICSNKIVKFNIIRRSIDFFFTERSKKKRKGTSD